jgi:CopG antitoxin of type II toxin-antitoxin system
MQTRKRDPLPENFDSLEEFWTFWDTHSTADYEDFMEDVDMHVDIRSSRVYYAVKKDIADQVRTQARRQGVSPEELINIWLREKAAEAVRNK